MNNNSTLSEKMQRSLDDALSDGITKEEILRSLSMRSLSTAGNCVYGEVKKYLSLTTL